MASYVTDQSGVNPNGSSSSSSSTSESTTKGKGEVAPPKLLRLQSAADYTVDESFAVDTRDHEDHTFCGIMFDLIVKDLSTVNRLFLDLNGCIHPCCHNVLKEYPQYPMNPPTIYDLKNL